MAGMGVLAADVDVDLPHPVALPLVDAVHEVELARLLEEAWIGTDVGEDEPAATVDVADQPQVGVHLRLVERLAALQLEIAGEELALEAAVAQERHAPHRVARPLVDHEGEHRPVAAGPVHHLQFAPHLRLEEAEAAVVGGEEVDVLVDLLPVDVAADDPEDPRLRLDLGEEPGIAGDGVAHEAGPQCLLAAPLVDEEHRPLVARLVALDGGDAGRLVALLVVEGLEPPPRLLDDVGIHRVTDVDLRLLAQGARHHALVADVADVAEHRPLHHLEHHHHPLGDADDLGVHVDEFPRPVQRADVLGDHLRIEILAGAGGELGQLRHLGGVVPLDPHLDDSLRGRSRLPWRGGDGGHGGDCGRRGRGRRGHHAGDDTGHRRWEGLRRGGYRRGGRRHGDRRCCGERRGKRCRWGGGHLRACRGVSGEGGGQHQHNGSPPPAGAEARRDGGAMAAAGLRHGATAAGCGTTADESRGEIAEATDWPQGELRHDPRQAGPGCRRGCLTGIPAERYCFSFAPPRGARFPGLAHAANGHRPAPCG